jgi:predicted RNA-binding protein (virulence factor B family)
MTRIKICIMKWCVEKKLLIGHHAKPQNKELWKQDMQAMSYLNISYDRRQNKTVSSRTPKASFLSQILSSAI